MKPLRDVHIPERLRLLLAPGEFADGDFAVVRGLERKVLKANRMVRGRYSRKEKTFTFNDRDVQTELEALSFLQAEFPGVISDWGGVIEDGIIPVEVLITARFAVALFELKGPKKASLLVVRQGMIEVSFRVPVVTGSVGTTLLAVEEEDPEAKEWMAPVSAEIVNAALIGT